MTDARRRRRQVLDRAPLLLSFGVLWVPLTVLVGLPVRWLFDRAEPLDEALLSAALSAVWTGPAISFGRVVGAESVRRADPDGEALRRAVRHGAMPDDDRLRAALPAYLARQRRGTLLALPLTLPACAALILFALLAAGSVRWAAIYALVAAVCLGVAALTLSRVRRLERRPTAPPGQGG